jgi:hypothetical protein
MSAITDVHRIVYWPASKASRFRNMRTLKKHQSLEEKGKGHFVCDKCFYQFAYSQPSAAQELTKQIDAVKSLYDQHLIKEDQYHELLKVLISVYIGKRVADSVNDRLSSVLRERLSPHRILESLALAP